MPKSILTVSRVSFFGQFFLAPTARSSGRSSTGRRRWPELFEAFRDRLPAAERADPLAAYLARLGDPDPAVHAPAAHAWFTYEHALSELAPRNVTLTGDVREGA